MIAQRLGELGITLSLGWHQNLTVSQISGAISELLPNFEKRQQMSDKGQNLVDGLGSERVILDKLIK